MQKNNQSASNFSEKAIKTQYPVLTPVIMSIAIEKQFMTNADKEKLI